MIRRLRVAVSALALSTVTGVAAQPAQDLCAMPAADRAWVDDVLAQWEAVSANALRLTSARVPWIVVFDASCVWHLNAEPAVLGARPAQSAHGGRVWLPDGKEIPPQITSFSGSAGADDRPYLVMALPAVWKQDPRNAADPTFDRLLRGVFVHEMTHTRQTSGIGRRIAALEQRSGLPAGFNDDIVQQRFAEREGFRASYERERDLLYEAAAARDPARRRQLAAAALAAMRERRGRYFTGADAVYADIEDLFLGMEGVASWAAYRAAIGEGLNEAEAVAFIRRGGRFWSQDEGLALFLVFDVLLPDWRARMFGETLPSVADTLEEAAR